ncbi:MAG: hypothetical protein ACF8XB_23340 [Planctomycetota bacterium JB042]
MRRVESRPTIGLALLLAAGHLLATLGLLVVSIGLTLREFDAEAPSRLLSAASTTCGAVAGALLLPGRWIWETCGSPNAPDVLEWLLFVANSLIWGVAGAVALRRLRVPRAVRPASSSSRPG